MLTFTNYRDLSDAYPVISANLQKILFEGDYDEPFMWSLGGDVHVIETKEEYRELLAKSAMFDVAEPMDDDWFLIVDITNNGGGPSYYVPMAIIDNEDRPQSFNA